MAKYIRISRRNKMNIFFCLSGHSYQFSIITHSKEITKIEWNKQVRKWAGSLVFKSHRALIGGHKSRIWQFSLLINEKYKFLVHKPSFPGKYSIFIRRRGIGFIFANYTHGEQFCYSDKPVHALIANIHNLVYLTKL